MTALTSLPSQLVAGDGYTIDLTYPAYLPNDGWTGVLYLRGVQVLKVTGTANGDSHRFTLPSATTAHLSEGTYELAVGLSLAGERVTVDSGFVYVKADFTTAGIRISHIEAVLSAITAVIEGRITDDVQTFSIGGRSLQHIPILELLDIRALYTKELATLRGNSIRRTVRLQFGGTT